MFRKAVAMAAFGSIVTGCSTASPTMYQALTSASQLQPNPQDKSGRIPYQYKAPVNWRQYDKIIVEPVVIYRGPDNQFVKIEENEKAELADDMATQFKQKLGSRFRIIGTRGPGTLRLRLTLTGAKKTSPVLGPLSRIDVGGGVYNTVQAIRDQEGAMTGSVSYAVEIHDAESDTLLYAYVTKQYPGAMNIGATFSSLEASKVGIGKGADALLADIGR
ncbi:DUF3313 domain-containing protein [Agrobacterium sp. NPDC089420]|uniref:DUF3313 domain-containing protein n=1 Tax=Agrobacterium sp. NPDC089420 TaxID=3363918 RepID=UPI00384B7457